MSVRQDRRTDSRERVRVRGEAFVAKVRELIHEGNVRRLVIKNDQGHTVMEIPVTAGVVTAIVAPVVTAAGAIAALANEWTIDVQLRQSEPEGEAGDDQ